MKKNVRNLFFALFLILSFVSCGDGDSKKIAQKPEGSEGGPCYGNKTCDDDLICEDGICVDPTKTDDKDSGNTADDGNTGNSGDTGNSGNSGDTGDTGNSGDTGDTGNSGDSGNSGNSADDTEKTDDDIKIPENCGNGKLDEGEECDDGNDWGGDGCTPLCKINVCGDGYKFVGVEECDDGDKNGFYDYCDVYCSGKSSYCGDGKVDVEHEECDTGNNVINERCSNCVLNKDFPKTICSDQILCSDASEIINCPSEGEDFFGQDAQYTNKCIPKKYSIVGSSPEEIIKDENTNLYWQRKLRSSTDCTWEEAKNYCNSLNYGGYNDWRLPSRNELATIINYKESELTINKEFFDFPSKSFWTSTFLANSMSNVWYVNFYTGIIGSGPKGVGELQCNFT